MKCFINHLSICAKCICTSGKITINYITISCCVANSATIVAGCEVIISTVDLTQANRGKSINNVVKLTVHGKWTILSVSADHSAIGAEIIPLVLFIVIIVDKTDTLVAVTINRETILFAVNFIPTSSTISTCIICRTVIVSGAGRGMIPLTGDKLTGCLELKRYVAVVISSNISISGCIKIVPLILDELPT